MGPRKLDLAIAAYRERHPHLVEASADFGAAIRAIIDEAGINYLTVESRAKSVASFATKARRLRDRRPDADPLTEITDQGIVIQDIDRGLIDFPAFIHGEEVFLCYELSDGDRIQYYHGLNAGYAGRQKLPEGLE